MPNYETLLADAVRLPVPDRIQLIDAIWDTLRPPNSCRRLPTSGSPRFRNDPRSTIPAMSKRFAGSKSEPKPWPA